MKLWIDTDPGVDDALALLMALAHPQAQVLGLGIVGGNVGVAPCTANALKLLDVIGRSDVPVYAGTPWPLLPPRASDAGHVHGRDGFGEFLLVGHVCGLEQDRSAQVRDSVQTAELCGRVPERLVYFTRMCRVERQAEYVGCRRRVLDL